MLTATVIVATHKKYRMPDDPLYLPMLVGAAGSDTDCEYAKDDFIKAEECDGHDLCKNRVEGGISEKKFYVLRVDRALCGLEESGYGLYRSGSLQKTFSVSKV